MKRMIMITATFAVLTSCGPSKEASAAREKLVIDSVLQATENSAKRKKEVQDSIAAAQLNQEALKQQLIELKAQLEAAEVKLNDTEQFKLLRTSEEKQEQIENQTRIVEELKSQIADLEKQIL